MKAVEHVPPSTERPAVSLRPCLEATTVVRDEKKTLPTAGLDSGARTRGVSLANRVLLVDDSEVFLEVANDMLTQQGWQVTAATSGGQALEVAVQWRPDIVVCDLRMPDMDGLELFRRLKQSDATLPVVIVSGADELKEILRVVHEGVFDFVPKEPDTETLLSAVRRAATHITIVRENIRLSEELQSTNADLETRVAERTKELVQTNRELEASLSTLATTQEQLLQAGKLAAIGTLVAGVAHEINNPLAYTVNNIEFAARRVSLVLEQLQSQASGDSAARAIVAQLEETAIALGEARHGVSRVGHVVGDLKSFARANDDERIPVDLGKLLDTCVRLASNEIVHRARLVIDYGVAQPVLANELRLGQVFLNLLLNAAQAIDPGHADDNEIRLATRTEDDGRIVVTIRDTGSGMPPTTLAKVFDPFFTTKPVGAGMGLGLAICHGIVSQLGGEISIESEVGKGTTARVKLPPAPSCAAPRLATTSLIPSTIVESARILVVDDEPLIGTSLRRTLEGEHIVHVVTSGHAALQLIRSGQHFDVILCDLMMPEMTGIDLYDELAGTAPDVAARIVFITGGAIDAGTKDFLQRVPSKHIQKPFDLDSLRKSIRETRCCSEARTAQSGKTASLG